MPIYATSYVVEWKPAGSWLTIPASSVLEVQPSGESALSDAGAGFGDVATMRASIKVLRAAVAGSTWARTPFRYTPTVGAYSGKAFVGVNEKASGDANTVTFGCVGMLDELPKRTKDLYSPAWYRRPAATKTTTSSIEDPTNGSYAAGLINYGFWQAGGRPFEQAGSYPTADFYYSCDQSQFASDWSWLQGEDAYEEMRRLARACGGQIYQRADGVVIYRQPLLMVGTVAYTFADSLAGASDSLGVYGPGSPEEEESTGQYFTKIVASFTPRRVRPMQEVLNDTTPRLVAPGASTVINLDAQWPLRTIRGGAGLIAQGATSGLSAELLTIQYLDGRPVPQDASDGYVHSVQLLGPRVRLTVANTSDFPFVVYGVRIHGEPIAAGERETITVGSGTPVMTMEDNLFVQRVGHAERLAAMGLAFYGTLRRVRRLGGCGQDPRRTQGETVGLTSSSLGLSNVPHIIIGIQTDERTKVSTYTLVDATGLPKASDYYIIGTTDYSGQTKQLAW